MCKKVETSNFGEFNHTFYLDVDFLLFSFRMSYTTKLVFAVIKKMIFIHYYYLLNMDFKIQSINTL